MKKLISLLCVTVMSLSLFVGCGASEPAEESSVTSAPSANEPAEPTADPIDINISAMKGPTAIGLSYFMNEADLGNLDDNNYHFSIATTTDEIVPKLAQGELDMAAIPANLSSVVYNKTEGDIQVLGINTLGVLNILETGDTIHSIKDLSGKTIYATGKNHTPEQVLTYLLNQNDMEIGVDVFVEWKNEPTECLSALASTENGIAMLPQPFASAAQIQNENIHVALDLTEEWDKLQTDSDNPSTLVTGVVVARKDFVENNPQAVSAFMKHYEESVDYVNNNVDEAAALVEQYGIVKAPIAKKAIPDCNIVFIDGKEMKDKLSGYLQVLFDQNPASVGGELPGDDFYFVE